MHRCTLLSVLILAFTVAFPGCAGKAMNPDRPMNRIAEDGAFLGWRLGKRFAPDERHFAATKRDDEWELRRPVTVGGRAIDHVIFEVEDGVLESVELRVAVSGEEASAALRDWARKLCEPLDADVDEFVPSPLGTPDPGAEEDWDPVITEHTRCDGDKDGVSYSIRQQTNSASDFHNASAQITLTALE